MACGGKFALVYWKVAGFICTLSGNFKYKFKLQNMAVFPSKIQNNKDRSNTKLIFTIWGETLIHLDYLCQNIKYVIFDVNNINRLI